MSYLSSKGGDEAKDIALTAQAAACAAWTVVNASSYNDTLQKKMDIGTCAVLGGLCSWALMN
eukprot:COSAG05_NODE_387_length_10460_cov_18.410096_6_plen_62_part_00